VTTETDPTGYEVASFNFAKLIHRYQRPFAKEDTSEALQYLLLIALNKDAPEPVGKEQRAICHDYIRELVIDTEKYAELLGDLRIDGVKTVRYQMLYFFRGERSLTSCAVVGWSIAG
jgi:nuclear pore complex protein Nup93